MFLFFFPVKGTYCHKIIRYIHSILETFSVKAEHGKLHYEVGNLEPFFLNAIVPTSKVNELNSVIKS